MNSLGTVGVIVLHLLLYAQGARIMMLTVFGSKSTTNNYQFIAEQLVDQGHEIIFVLLEDTAKHSSPNITYVALPYQTSFGNYTKSFFTHNPLNFYPVDMIFFQPAMADMCRQAYHGKEFPGLLSYRGKIDLIIFDFYLQDCFLPLAHFINAPIVFYHGNAPEPTSSYIMQIPTPYSYVQHAFYQPQLPMKFFNRLWSSFTHFLSRKTYEWLYYPAFEDIAKDFIPNSPPIKEIIKNVSFLMGSFDSAWGAARPTIPTTVDVTCAHFRPAKKVSKEIENVIQESGEHGFIIFSMGTFFGTDFFPPGYLEIFLSAFSKLKQVVIWKSFPVDNLPPNVKTFAWLPQQDLLGHPKARLFITHGGMYSLHEAMHHGIPIVGIGVFADQEDNLLHAEQKGVAVSLNRMNITSDCLYDAIVTVLNDPSYKAKAKQISNIMHDQPTTPLQRALFAIEYVLRHGDVSHLRSPNISFVEYFCIDVIICLNLIIVTFLFISYALAKNCMRIIRYKIR